MDPGLYYLLDAVGTMAFAMSGAFKAVRHRLDLLGVLVLGFATTSIATFAVTFLLRVMAIWRGWHLPRLPA
jgi:uncharacterized membrane protein YeiH